MDGRAARGRDAGKGKKWWLVKMRMARVREFGKWKGGCMVVGKGGLWVDNLAPEILKDPMKLMILKKVY